MWSIGNLKLKTPVVLGPMAGVTTESYRKFMVPFGASLSITEMTSDVGIIYGSRKTKEFVNFSDGCNTGLQLFGNSPDVLLKEAKIALNLNENIKLIDINMGCPVSKVVKKGSGSTLMKDPKLCGNIISNLKENLKVPVTAKIRLGIKENSINFREVIDELLNAKVDAISLHVRTAEEKYAGKLHYELVENLQDELPIPLIISGNIFSLDDAIKAKEITNAEGIMVARGGVGNPFLITQICKYFEKNEILPSPTMKQQVDWCIEFADMLIEEKGEDVAIRSLRSIAPKFVSNCRNCREIRKRISTEIKDRNSLVNLLEIALDL